MTAFAGMPMIKIVRQKRIVRDRLTLTIKRIKQRRTVQDQLARADRMVSHGLLGPFTECPFVVSGTVCTESVERGLHPWDRHTGVFLLGGGGAM